MWWGYVSTTMKVSPLIYIYLEIGKPAKNPENRKSRMCGKSGGNEKWRNNESFRFYMLQTDSAFPIGLDRTGSSLQKRLALLSRSAGSALKEFFTVLESSYRGVFCLNPGSISVWLKERRKKRVKKMCYRSRHVLAWCLLFHISARFQFGWKVDANPS